MSYLTQSHIAQDTVLQRRIIACAALEGVPDPQFWVGSMMWRFSTQPGWVEAYKAATHPEGGANEGAVTDSMILEAVTALYEPPSPTPASTPPESPA